MRLLQDVKFAVRSLARSPGFSAVVILTLALGIGASTAIFAVVHAVVLQPLEYPQPQQLARITSELSRLGATDTGVSAAELFDYQAQTEIFAGVAGVMPVSANVTSGDTPERIEMMLVSRNYFDVLGIPPAHGRTFRAEDEVPGVANVAVVSHAFWQRRLGSDPQAVGRTIVIDDDPVEVVGVMPRHFSHPGRTVEGDVDVWSPAGFRTADGAPPLRSRRRLEGCLARLRPGLTLEEAYARLADYGVRARADFPSDYPADQGWRPRLIPLQQDIVQGVATPMFVLLAGVGLLLLVACVNIAHVALARSSARRQEMAIRRALGASRLRLVKQLFVESGVIAAAGGLLALLVGLWGVRALSALAPSGVPRIDDVAMDVNAVLVTAAISVGVAIMLALLSSAYLVVDRGPAGLKSAGGRSTDRGGDRARSIFVVAEVAMATVLLVGAGLMVRSLVEVLNVPVGFEVDRLLTARVTLPFPNDRTRAEYLDQARRTQWYREVLDRISALPGVDRAAMSSQVPLGGFNPPLFVELEGDDTASPARPVMHLYRISPSYFDTMGVTLVRGRSFAASDQTSGEPVAIVSEAAVRSFWRGRDPIGSRVRFGPGSPWMTVVGIAQDLLNRRLTEAPQPMLYQPLDQGSDLTFALLVRSTDDGRHLRQAIEREVRAVDPDLPIYSVRSMDDLLAAHVAQRRFLMRVLVTFGGVATILAVFGIYGVMAYSVSQRTREIGIRVAIGARPEDVTRMILSRGLMLTVAGLALGTLVSLLMTGLLRSQLFGVQPSDPLTFVSVLGVMTAVAAGAAYLPARRAAVVDPVMALRSE